MGIWFLERSSKQLRSKRCWYRAHYDFWALASWCCGQAIWHFAHEHWHAKSRQIPCNIILNIIDKYISNAITIAAAPI